MIPIAVQIGGLAVATALLLPCLMLWLLNAEAGKKAKTPPSTHSAIEASADAT
ncbi:hypothetical protein [Brucella anthropi]|uniref:hypothetical protein n=1 Tax=Brucella anthropi TaxID=529 RepID=UPI003EE04C24